MQLSLTDPQEQFVFSEAAHPALVAGLGCVHPDTKIWTEHGLMRIADITRPVRVVSWNEKDQKFQLSLSGGAFPKEKANLYRVATRQGEFVASEHHHVFSSDCNYVSVQSLLERVSAKTVLPDLLRSNLEFGPLLSSLDVQNYSQTDEDYLDYYASAARQYGQRLLEDQDNDQSSPPSKGDAHKLPHKSALRVFLSAGDLVARTLKHIRHGLSCALKQTPGYACQSSALAVNAGDHTSSSRLERISRTRQPLRQSRLKSFARRTVEKFYYVFRNLSSVQASQTSSCKVVAVSVVEHQVYYDMQVFETNNYVCENGFIHHNSGKTEAAICRLLIRMVQQPGIDTAFYLPTYDLIKLRAMPGTEERLAQLGLAYTTNRSDYAIKVHGYGSIIFRSYDRPERIVSYEVADSIVDELDTLPKEKAAYVWRKVSERNRQRCGRPNTLGNVTTPDQGYSGFTYEKWVKKRQPGYELIKAATSSNVFLPDGYIEQIRANYDPILADMYLNGEFVSLSQNKVYHFFDRNKHHTDRALADSDKFIHIGLDFNIGGTCATVWVIEDNKPIAVDEFVSHDTMDFCNNLTKYAADGRKIIVYPDASGKSGSTNASQSDIQIILQAGYRVDCGDSNPAVRDRINAMNGLLAHDKMRVNTDKCPNLTDALESQGYDKKGDPEKFNTHPAIDDWVDSCGYFLYRKWPVRRPVSSGVEMGGRW